MSRAALIESARDLARGLRAQYGAQSAFVLARLCGIEVVRQSWQVAGGRVLYFAESTRRPLRIVLNEAALEGYQPDEVERLSEIIIAHELGHLLLPQPAAWDSHSKYEEAAHVFAQELTSLPFHPTYYAQLLRQPRTVHE
jgi:hypothetical protein